MGDARSLLGNAAVLIDVMQSLADLNESHILVALDDGAVNVTAAALAIIALAVPTVEGKGDTLCSLAEEALEVLAGDRRVGINQVQALSQCVGVHGVQCQQLKRYWHLPCIKNQIEYLGQNTLR